MFNGYVQYVVDVVYEWMDAQGLTQWLANYVTVKQKILKGFGIKKMFPHCKLFNKIPIINELYYN